MAPGRGSRGTETMVNEITEDQSSNDQSLMEITNALHHLTLADAALNCQVCNVALTDGDEILCHLQCPAGETGYDITQTRCLAHSDDIESLLTLSTDELLVAGRIGRCSDQATQQSWPILLAPELQVVSPAATATGKRVSTQSNGDDDPADSLAVGTDCTAAESNTPSQSARESDTPSGQETTLARWGQSGTTAEGE